MKEFNYEQYLTEGWMFKEAGETVTEYTFVGFYFSRGVSDGDLKKITVQVRGGKIDSSMSLDDFWDVLEARYDSEDDWRSLWDVFEEFCVLWIEQNGKVVWKCTEEDGDWTRYDLEDALEQNPSPELKAAIEQALNIEEG